MSERKEAWMKIPVGIVSGIILEVWKILAAIVAVINWVATVFSGKRNKGMAEFCENWNTQKYIFIRYMVSLSDKRPFPFTDLAKHMSKFEK
jgi:hypothetical protein